MKRSWLRTLPALFVAFLLLLTALAASPLGNQRVTSIQTVTIAPQWGITQPFAASGNIAACSLRIVPPPYSSSELRILQWDPVLLTPDPTTVALRSLHVGPSDLAWNRLRASFSLPIITRFLSKVADPPRTTLAIDYQATDAFNGQSLYFESDGNPDQPVAYRYQGAGPRTPLPGAHPVMIHATYGAATTLQDLFVAQCVMTTNVLTGTASYELMQRFRVPVPTDLRWVEFALGLPPNFGATGRLAIFDANGVATPPPALPGEMAGAPFYHPGAPAPFWQSHFDFDRVPMLMPDHDYWLFVRVQHQLQLYARTLTGSEGPNFVENIGPLYSRPDPAGAFEVVPGQALSFRLIGEAPNVTGVSPATPNGSSFRMSVSPNPSRGTVFVAWSGAQGAVHFEVLDPRGRRVGDGAGASSGAGRWTWRAATRDGRPLPAGVYFVRAGDERGSRAIERLVLVR